MYLFIFQKWDFNTFIKMVSSLLQLVLSRYQNFSIRYRYQWKSTVLGTNFGTKAKHKNMLIKNILFLLIKSNKNKCKKIYAIVYIYLKLFSSFSQ